MSIRFKHELEQMPLSKTWSKTVLRDSLSLHAFCVTRPSAPVASVFYIMDLRPSSLSQIEGDDYHGRLEDNAGVHTHARDSTDAHTCEQQTVCGGLWTHSQSADCPPTQPPLKRQLLPCRKSLPGASFSLWGYLKLSLHF